MHMLAWLAYVLDCISFGTYIHPLVRSRRYLANTPTVRVGSSNAFKYITDFTESQDVSNTPHSIVVKLTHCRSPQSGRPL